MSYTEDKTEAAVNERQGMSPGVMEPTEPTGPRIIGLDLGGFVPASAEPLPASDVGNQARTQARPAGFDDEEDLIEPAPEAPLVPVRSREVETVEAAEAEPVGGITLKQKAIGAAAGVAALVAAVVMLTGKPTATPVAPLAPVAVSAPTVPGLPPHAPTPGPGGVVTVISAPSPDSTVRDEAETAADLQPWPANERNCDAKGLTGFDQGVCTREGAPAYFRCAPDGRRWDITLPGCDRG